MCGTSNILLQHVKKSWINNNNKNLEVANFAYSGMMEEYTGTLFWNREWYFHTIIESWFVLEWTFKDHLVPVPLAVAIRKKEKLVWLENESRKQ